MSLEAREVEALRSLLQTGFDSESVLHHGGLSSGWLPGGYLLPAGTCRFTPGLQNGSWGVGLLDRSPNAELKLDRRLFDLRKEGWEIGQELQLDL